MHEDHENIDITHKDLMERLTRGEARMKWYVSGFCTVLVMMVSYLVNSASAQSASNERFIDTLGQVNNRVAAAEQSDTARRGEFSLIIKGLTDNLTQLSLSTQRLNDKLDREMTRHEDRMHVNGDR